MLRERNFFSERERQRDKETSVQLNGEEIYTSRHFQKIDRDIEKVIEEGRHRKERD